MSKKIIAIVGATGAQGGGLARAILQDAASEFSVRALTRNPNSDAAKQLASMGAELVAADLDDMGSIGKAFTGAYGAFCVTPFWEHMSPEKELQQAKNMAQAAADADVQHVIWSTLDDTRKWVPLDDERIPTLYGAYKVPHFDAKGEADAYFSDLQLPVTYLLTCFYWDNLIYFGMGPKRGEDGKVGFVLPMADKKLPGIAAADIGKCALGVFKNRAQYLNQRVGIAGECVTGEQMANALSEVLEQPVHYQYVPPEIYRTFGFPGAEDLANMFQFKRDFEADYCASRSPTVAAQLNPELQTFKQWLLNNKGRIAVT